MLIKLTEIGRLGGCNEVRPGGEVMDSSFWIAMGLEMIFEQDPCTLFVEGNQVLRVKRAKIPVYKWVPKYKNKEEMKKAIPWYKRIFLFDFENPMKKGEYKTIKSVECTKVIMSSGATYLVAETPDAIIKMQMKIK